MLSKAIYSLAALVFTVNAYFAINEYRHSQVDFVPPHSHEKIMQASHDSQKESSDLTATFYKECAGKLALKASEEALRLFGRNRFSASELYEKTHKCDEITARLEASTRKPSIALHYIQQNDAAERLYPVVREAHTTAFNLWFASALVTPLLLAGFGRLVQGAEENKGEKDA